MQAGADGVKAHQIARQVEAGNLLIALLGDGVAFDGPGANGIQRFQLITGFEQGLTFLDGLFPLDNIIQLIKLVLVQSKGDAELADTAILTMDSTTARLNASNNSLLRDHMSAQALIDIGQF